MRKNGAVRAFENRLDSLKESVRHMVDVGGEQASHLKERAIDVKDVVVEKGGAALTRTGSLIKEHPIIAIGIAFGAGYLVMRLMKR